MRSCGSVGGVFALSVLFSFCAQAAPFETGWLKDEKGSFDPTSKAKVFVVANMHGSADEKGEMKWQTRYVAIEIPVPGLRAKGLTAIDRSGAIISQSDAETHSIGTTGTMVKLFFDRPAGFSFRLRFP